MTGRGPDHRVRRALSLQRWSNLTFLHWALPVSAVAEQLPPGLEVDRFDGRAWVGLTPLVMRDVRAPYVPAVPHLSDFVEVNLRTYVRGPDGTGGIWFFSLECARLPVVLALRTLALPYQWARAEAATRPARIAYRTHRVGTGVGMRAAVQVGEPVEPDPLTTFLTARWWAYTRLGATAVARAGRARAVAAAPGSRARGRQRPVPRRGASRPLGRAPRPLQPRRPRAGAGHRSPHEWRRDRTGPTSGAAGARQAGEAGEADIGRRGR